ncbi:MAG: NUDIX hydrolase [Cyclobacteriaceae bacterium]|nr:NUDIX hydrolase [Cyclobacteriaceae bacterium]MDH5249879.1 NUDIX hydrolase [Cyclobacteriaceae bacterium]
MNREFLIAALKNYHAFAEEEIFIPKFLDLLLHRDAYQRDHLPGHITGSAWIVDTSGNFVLLTHHAKLNKWLQPGGHADGDENILNVALREAREETGLSDFKLLENGIFDIDIHTIPARKEFPQHLHYDVRFLIEGDKEQSLLVTRESHALAWIPMHQLVHLTEENASILRMANKLSRLF